MALEPLDQVLQSAGARVMPICYDSTPAELDKIFKSVNGDLVSTVLCGKFIQVCCSLVEISIIVPAQKNFTL